MNSSSRLQLGQLKFDTQLVQGPLAGYSCAPFRMLTHEYGAPAFCMTEMISAKDLAYRNPNPKRFIWRHPDERCLAYQLAADEPEALGRAVSIVERAGADIIDLNCGCPVKKIRKKGSGSKLLAQPEILYTLVKAMRENTDKTLSVKIRVGANKGDQDNLAIVQAIEAGGANFITVHGRHWTERYDVPVRTAEIAEIVKSTTLPVLANGDANDVASVRQLLEQTQCAGVMIARASVGRPWLFAQLRAELAGQSYTPPTLPEIGAIMIRHLTGLAELDSPKLATLQGRKLAKYYGKNLTNSRDFVLAMQVATELTAAINIIHTHFV